MKKTLFAVLLTALTVTFSSGCLSNKADISIGAKAMTEHDILGHVLKFLIDEHTNLSTRVVSNMDSFLSFEAIKSGQTNVGIDYTGTIYGSYFGYTDRISVEEIHDIVRTELKDRHNILMLDQLGFNSTYTMSVRPDTAEQYNLKTFSDLAKAAPELVIGATIESFNREDSIKGAIAAYDMRFLREVVVEGTLRYAAILNDEVQVIDAYSTEGLLLRHNLVVLEDDKVFFPSYHAAIIIRQDVAEKYPELIPVLNMLTGTITEDRMMQMNHRVDVLQENPQDVAKDFLRAEGLIM